MNFDLILTEWCYRCDKGYPRLHNPKDINILRTVLREQQYPLPFIDAYINILIEKKTKSTGIIPADPTDTGIPRYYYKTEDGDDVKAVTPKTAKEQGLDPATKEDFSSTVGDDDPEIKSKTPDKQKDGTGKEEEFTGEIQNLESRSSQVENKLKTVKKALDKSDSKKSEEHKKITRDFISDTESLLELVKTNPSKAKKLARHMLEKYQLKLNATPEGENDKVKIYAKVFGTVRDETKILGDNSTMSTALANIFSDLGEEIEAEAYGLRNKTLSPTAVITGSRKMQAKITDDGVTLEGKEIKFIDTKKYNYKAAADKFGEQGYSADEVAEKIRTLKTLHKKHNSTVKNMRVFFESNDLEILDPAPGEDMHTEKGRDNIINNVLAGVQKQILNKLPKSIDPRKLDKLLNQFEKLKGIPKEEFDATLNELLQTIDQTPEIKNTAADLTELVVYMRELKQGRPAFFPASSNFATADLFVFSQHGLTDTYVSPEFLSVKSGKGGASSAAPKIEKTEFKTEGMQEDLQKLMSMNDKIFKGGPEGLKESEDFYDQLLEKHKHLLDRDTIEFLETKIAGLPSIIANMQRTHGPKMVTEQQMALHKLGYLMQVLHNTDVNYQTYENISVSKGKKSAEFKKMDGVYNKSMMEYVPNYGVFTDLGAPGNFWPTRIVSVATWETSKKSKKK